MVPGNTPGKDVFILFRGAFPEGSGATDRIMVLADAFRHLGFNTRLVLSRQVPVSGTSFSFEVDYWGTPLHQRSRLIKWLHERNCSLRLIKQLKACEKPGILWIYHPDLLFHQPLINWARKHQWQVYGEQTELNSAVAEVKEMQQNRLYSLLARLNERLLPSRFSKWIVISRLMQDFYSRKNNTRVQQLGLILPGKQFSFEEHAPSNLWGFTGSFGHKDGIPFLLKSFALARAQRPALRLLLAGDCPFPEKIREQASNAGLPETAIEISGFLPRIELLEKLKRCDGLLITRPDNAYANAGFPQKLATYLEAGRPIISTYSIELEELEGITLVHPEQTAALAEQILGAYAHWEEWNRQGAVFQQLAGEKFNGVKSLALVLDLIDSKPANN